MRRMQNRIYTSASVQSQLCLVQNRALKVTWKPDSALRGNLWAFMFDFFTDNKADAGKASEYSLFTSVARAQACLTCNQVFVCSANLEDKPGSPTPCGL